MNETLILLLAFIAVMALWLVVLWAIRFVNYDDGIGEPVLTAKPAPRRVRAGQPVVDLDATEKAAMLAACIDFDDDTKTDNPETRHSQAFAVWAVTYEKTMHELRSSAAVTMLPAP